jgi:hypothetical protein
MDFGLSFCMMSQIFLNYARTWSFRVRTWSFTVQMSNWFWLNLVSTNYQISTRWRSSSTANNVQIWLGFLEKTQYPPRSQYLNPLVTFIYGVISRRWRYNPSPKSLASIRREIKKISKNLFGSTFVNFKKRCNLVISTGKYVWQYNFKILLIYRRFDALSSYVKNTLYIITSDT